MRKRLHFYNAWNSSAHAVHENKKKRARKFSIFQALFWEVTDFVSLTCKFHNFNNSFATITSLSELSFWHRKFILLVKTKEVISMSCDGSSTSSWKPWRGRAFELIFSMRNIYTSIPIWTNYSYWSSSKSTQCKDNLLLGHLLYDLESYPNQHKNNQNCTIKRNITFEFARMSMKTKTTTWSEFPKGISHFRTNTSVRSW